MQGVKKYGLRYNCHSGYERFKSLRHPPKKQSIANNVENPIYEAEIYYINI